MLCDICPQAKLQPGFGSKPMSNNSPGDATRFQNHVQSNQGYWDIKMRSERKVRNQKEELVPLQYHGKLQLQKRRQKGLLESGIQAV